MSDRPPCAICGSRLAHSTPRFQSRLAHVGFRKGKRMKPSFRMARYQGPHNDSPTIKISLYALGYGLWIDFQ